MSNIINALTTTNLDIQLKPDIASTIALINPWMKTPLTSLLFKMNFFNMANELSKGGKVPMDLATVEKTVNRSFSDFEDEFLAKASAVTGGTALASNTASDNTLIVADASIFRAGDVINITVVTTGARREVAYVQAVNTSTNTLTLVRSASLGTLSSTIAATDVVYKISTASGEGSGTTSIVSTSKTKRTNYVQNFKTTWGMTEQMLKSATWTEAEYAYQKKKALMQLWEDIELALFQGVAGFEVVEDAAGNKVTLTGGIFEGIRDGGGAATDVGANIVKSEIDALIKSTYTEYGQSTKGRIFLCSADAVSDFDALVNATDGYQKNVNSGDTLKLGYGISSYRTSFTQDGGIPILHSPVFDRAGIKGALLLDLDTIKLKEFIPFRVDKIVQTSNKQVEEEGVVGEYGLSRVMFKKNGYLKLDGSTEPIS
jgi:hypothetical protein